MGKKKLQKPKFSGGKLYLFFALGFCLKDTSACSVDPERSHHKLRLLRLSFGIAAAQMSLDARHKFPRTERLSDVIVTADFEPKNAVYLIRTSRQKNNRGAREFTALANPPTEIEAVLT